MLLDSSMIRTPHTTLCSLKNQRCSDTESLC